MKRFPDMLSHLAPGKLLAVLTEEVRIREKLLRAAALDIVLFKKVRCILQNADLATDQ